MTKVTVPLIFLVLVQISWTTRGAERFAAPSNDTKKYLAELLSSQEQGRNQIFDVIATEIMTLETLLSVEIVKPTITRMKGSYGIQGESEVLVTAVLQFPPKCEYARNMPRGNLSFDTTVLVEEVSIDSPRAVVFIVITNHRANGKVRVYREAITAEFQQQVDLNRDGKWDKESCWVISQRQ